MRSSTKIFKLYPFIFIFIFIFFLSCGEIGLISRGDEDGAVDLSLNKDLKNKQPEAKVNKNIPVNPANPKTDSKVVNTNIPVTPTRPNLEVLPVNDPTKIADVINKNPIESKVEPIDPDHRLVGADIPDIGPGEMPDYSGYARVYQYGCGAQQNDCKKEARRERGNCNRTIGDDNRSMSDDEYTEAIHNCKDDYDADTKQCDTQKADCDKCVKSGRPPDKCVGRDFTDFTDFLSFLDDLQRLIDQMKSYLDNFILDESLPDDEDFAHNMDQWITRTDFLEEVVNLAVERQILPAQTPSVNQMANPVR